MDDIAFASATELAARIRSRELGSRELLDLYLARIERHNPVVNAVVALQLAQARASANAADAALVRGDALGPLHGVPITVKESFDVAGLPTTWGHPAQRHNTASTTAVAVRRLQDAGAVVFGKTNVPLMLADWQSFNAIHGTTSNPWDLSRTPGGSSGGSAAALAAGLTGLEFGSDIGGSLRVPAHFCGVYAHKPTYGIVPPSGHGLGPGPRTDVSVCGPMARSVADLELALTWTAGPDGPDARAWRLALPVCERREARDFRVAVLLDATQSVVDEDVRNGVQAVADFLASRGARVQAARPAIDFDQVARDATLLIRSTTSGRMPASDDERLQHERAALHPDDHSHAAQMTRALTASHREWLQAHARRHAMQQAWETFFQSWDVLLCPPAASVAFRHDHSQPRHARTVVVNGRERPSIEQVFWTGLAGIAYLPVTVVPAGFSRERLPTGVQIIGPRYGDRTCLALAGLLEREFQGFRRPPLA